MGHYEQRFWLSDVLGMRNERRSGPYYPYVPDTLQDRDIRLSPSAVQTVARAQADLLLGKLLDNPVTSISAAKRLTGRNYEASRNAVATLVSVGILVQNSRNRKSGIYVAPDVLGSSRSTSERWPCRVVIRPSRNLAVRFCSDRAMNSGPLDGGLAPGAILQCQSLRRPVCF